MQGWKNTSNSYKSSHWHSYFLESRAKANIKVILPGKKKGNLFIFFNLNQTAGNSANSEISSLSKNITFCWITPVKKVLNAFMWWFLGTARWEDILGEAYIWSCLNICFFIALKIKRPFSNVMYIADWIDSWEGQCRFKAVVSPHLELAIYSIVYRYLHFSIFR